jgi:hypothetical protein
MQRWGGDPAGWRRSRGVARMRPIGHHALPLWNLSRSYMIDADMCLRGHCGALLRPVDQPRAAPDCWGVAVGSSRASNRFSTTNHVARA